MVEIFCQHDLAVDSLDSFDRFVVKFFFEGITVKAASAQNEGLNVSSAPQ